jgi:hypothetical protein
MGSFLSKDKGYEIVNFPNENNYVTEDHKLIIQVTRKIDLITSLKNYFDNASIKSAYHKHIIGTLEYESVHGTTIVYKIYSNFFYTIFRMQIFKGDEYTF